MDKRKQSNGTDLVKVEIPWVYFQMPIAVLLLTHWGQVTHICVSKLAIIGSDNGLSPSQRQAIIWTNAGILLIGPLGTNFNETSIEIHTFSLEKIYLKLLSGKWRPFCLGLKVLTIIWQLSWRIVEPYSVDWSLGITLNASWISSTIIHDAPNTDELTHPGREKWLPFTRQHF